MTLRISIRQLLACGALALSGAALAAPVAPSPQQSGTDAQGHHGMMGGGMMGAGMMDMHACQSMMGSGPGMSGLGLPKLPPGNEKLESQMQAEMLQKMGEIAARYADRVKDSR
jgi:hypothetical protein